MSQNRRARQVTEKTFRYIASALVIVLAIAILIGIVAGTSDIISFRNAQILNNLTVQGEFLPDGATCANGQIIKKSGADTWVCAYDGGNSSTEIINAVNASTGYFSNMKNNWNNLQNMPTNLDTDSTNDLTTSTSWSGDLSGTGASPQVVDSSHLHDASNITSGTLSFSRGGTGLSSATEDSVMVGASVAGWQAKTLPLCTGTGKLLYDTSTNTFSCGTDQTGGTMNSWTISADTGSDAVSDGQTVTIAGGANGIDTSESGRTVTLNLDWTEVGTDAISEAKIDFDTSCASTSKLYVNGNDLACNADDDQPDSDAEVPDAITVSGGTLGSNTIASGAAWTVTNTLNIDSGTLYVDGANDRVGIGTTGPLAKLHAGTSVSDTSTYSFANTGAVITSIGVDHTAGRTNALALMRDGTSGVVYAGLAAFDLSRWSADGVNARTQLDIRLANTDTNTLTDVLSLRSDGNVGMGTTSPGQTLTVAGTANVTGAAYLGNSKCGSGYALTTDSVTGLISCTAVGTGSMSSFNIAGDSGSDSVTNGQTVTIAGGTNGIDTSESGRTVTLNLDWTEVGTDAISEAKIDFDTSCASTSKLYVNGNDLACNADDDQPDSDAEVPDAITVSGGTLGSNTIASGAAWTVTNTLNIDSNTLYVDGTNNRVGVGINSPTRTFEVSDGTKGITLDPTQVSPVINTTASTDLTITSSSGNVIIKLG